MNKDDPNGAADTGHSGPVGQGKAGLADSRQKNTWGGENAGIADETAALPSREKLLAAREDAIQIRESSLDRRKANAARHEKEIPAEEAAPNPLILMLQQVNANLVIVSIEAQKIAEQNKIAQEALKDADRRKNEFLAMLGHELRNPLTPISNVAQILQSPSLDEATLLWACEVLNRNVAHMTKLVDDLLDVSRINQGLVKIQRERIELTKLLKDSAESMQTLTQSKQQTLALQLSSQPIYLEGDPVRLTQVFVNLLNNSAKYTGEGGHIDLSVSMEGSWVSVRVQDNGMGISPELLPYIFDMFTQGERALDRSEGGLGLGLTLVKKLVKLHGGQIAANSRGINQGAEFVVQLPIIVEATARTEPENPREVNQEAEQGLRILLIDDNHDVVDSLSLWLETLGHQVEIARNGIQGINATQDFNPDVVVLDIGLPDMDGYQVARKLREQKVTQKTLIIALSGYGPEKGEPGAEASDFDHYVIKPNLNELRNLIAEYQRSKHGDRVH